MSAATRAILVVLLVASVAVRLAFVRDYRFEGIDRDTAGYMNLAESIAGGEGWVNHSVRYLYALPDSIPYPDSYWSPLFPLLLAGVFRSVGDSFRHAQAVPFLFGIFVPLVVFFLASSLTRSRATATIAGLIAVFHPTLATSSCRVMPEIVMIFFVGLTLALLLHPGEGRRKEVWLGVVLGLGYLVKYQNGALVVPVIAYYLLARPWKEALARIVTVGVVSVLVTSPWLVRNAVVFGDPFYSMVRGGIISYYPEFAGEARFVASLQPPPPAWPYILTHLVDAKGLVHNSLYTVVGPFFRDYAGSFVLIPFVALGLVTMGGAWRRWVPLALFCAFIVGFFSITMPLVRYVLVVLPVWIVFAAAGMGVLIHARPGDAVGTATRVAVSIVLAWVLIGQMRHTAGIAHDTESAWTPSANFGVLEAQAVAGFVDSHTQTSDVVLAAETYHYALILDRGAVQIPYDDETLRHLRDRYRVRYLVSSVRDLERRLPSWLDDPPEWADLVYRVRASDIPRPAWNPGYTHVSEMRVYELR